MCVCVCVCVCVCRSAIDSIRSGGVDELVRLRENETADGVFFDLMIIIR